MQTLPRTTASVNWTVPSASIAYMMGAADAAHGDACVPEMIFTHIDDKRDYCAGYASVTGPTLTTRFFLGGNN